jgi:CRP/FNR family cyclic AMP-dependent transcriptional regulator
LTASVSGEEQGLLSRVPLLRALPEQTRLSLASSLEHRVCAAGEQIFRRGDPGDRLYLVVEGEVEITLPGERNGNPVVLRRMAAGDHFGELALLDGGARTAGASAATAVRLLGLSREDFLAAALGSPDVSRLVMLELTARLRNTTTLLADRASRDVVRELDAELTTGDRISNRVAQWNGSWGFIAAMLLLSGGWIAFNAVGRLAFDPFPYVFFNLVLAVLVVLQGPLLMMAQNRENRQERVRSDVDYRVNLKNELAIERIGQDVERLVKQMAAVQAQLDRSRPE